MRLETRGLLEDFTRLVGSVQRLVRLIFARLARECLGAVLFPIFIKNFASRFVLVFANDRRNITRLDDDAHWLVKKSAL